MSEITDDLLQHGFRYAYSLCHQTADAEDLVHDAWLKLLTSNKKVSKGLLFSSIRNLFIDQYRRSNLINIDIDLQVNELPMHDVNDELLVSKDALQHALSLLRASEREVLFLHSVEGYTASEIAKLTKSSRGTVLSSLFRSKRKLKKTLNNHEAKPLSAVSGERS